MASMAHRAKAMMKYVVVVFLFSAFHALIYGVFSCALRVLHVVFFVDPPFQSHPAILFILFLIVCACSLSQRLQRRLPYLTQTFAHVLGVNPPSQYQPSRASSTHLSGPQVAVQCKAGCDTFIASPRHTKVDETKAG